MSVNRKELRTVLLGCGNIAHVHMKFLKKTGRDVAAVCDASTVRAELFAQKYDIPSHYTDLDVMLSAEKPDVVHLLTPPHTHYQLIVKLIEAGCHVLAEKPLCETREQSDAIFAKAKEKDVLVGVDHTRVYHPMIVRARDLIASGEFGDIVRIEYEYDDPSLLKILGEDTKYRWAKGAPPWAGRIRGGILADLLPHPLSVALSFDEGFSVSYVSARSIEENIPEEIIAILSSEKTDAIIKLSLNSKPLKNVLHLYCQKGYLRIDLRNMLMVVLPERQMPNIVSRVVNALSESCQVLFGFSVSVVKLLFGKAHPYDGLEDVFTFLY